MIRLSSEFVLHIPAAMFLLLNCFSLTTQTLSQGLFISHTGTVIIGFVQRFVALDLRVGFATCPCVKGCYFLTLCIYLFNGDVTILISIKGKAGISGLSLLPASCLKGKMKNRQTPLGTGTVKIKHYPNLKNCFSEVTGLKKMSFSVRFFFFFHESQFVNYYKQLIVLFAKIMPGMITVCV